MHPSVRALAALALLVVPGAARAQLASLPDNYLRPLTARHIGPANMSGRVTALAVVEKSPAIQYVGTASGGVWKTSDAGKTWAPLFDDQPTAAIGAVAVSQADPNVVWVGTGEANARNSVSWGDGVYLSRDGGKSWRNVGLRETRHIGKIVVHPRAADTAYVAALGHVWGPNRERGVFKTTDGGKTWQHVLALDDRTGCVDLVMVPDEPDTLYAAAYSVRRDGFSGGNPAVQFGPRAGLYRTRDGGKTWVKLARGLPARSIGRCGLDVFRKGPRTLYAVVQTDLTNISKVVGQAARASNDPNTGGVFRSDDGGDTWVKLNDLCPRPFYFGQIRIDPLDDRRIYVLGIPLYVSGDGGRTFRDNGAKGGVHVDHHDLWIDPSDTRRLLLGNDGGVYHSADRGVTWAHVRNLPVAQFYGITVDMRKPYRVYGGLQDNGTWGGPSRTRDPEGITLDHWKRYLPGDGFQCQADPDDINTLFAEAQYGRTSRLDLSAAKRVLIRPEPPKGAPGFRFNWSTPLVLSPHKPRALYIGGNYLFRSLDRGNTWQVISPDLTRGQPGPSAHTGHTLTTVAESPAQPGVLWAGSDDGLVHVSRNGGRNWVNVSGRIPGVPAARWITRIEPAPFDAGTAYLSLDRHRQDDLAPYLFKTTDYGLTWRPLTKGLPKEGVIHVVRADPRNRNLLYVGTEQGLFLSFDEGANWQRFRGGLPTVPVHDLVVQPRDRELVIGTHGRGIYIVDVAPLQELSGKVLAAPAHLFEVRPTALPGVALPRRGGPGPFAAPNPPVGVGIYYAMKEKGARPRLTVTDSAGAVVADLAGMAEPGLHRAQWDLRREGEEVAPGEYTVRLRVGEMVLTKKLRVEAE